MNRFSRRGFLSTSAAFVGTAAATRAALGTDQPAQVTPLNTNDSALDDSFGSAKRVIFAVADGMSMGTMTLADLYSKIVLGRDTFWPRLMAQPGIVNALCSTYSANSLVTDSAAASTTWSSGMRVDNGSIGYTPQGQALEPILMRTHNAGLRTGLVTTAKVTDATPAGFIANVPRRTMEQDIANQIMHRAPNIVLGGGAKFFSPESRKNFTGRYTENHRAIRDVQHARSTIGLFAHDHIPYHLDRDGDDADLLSMTKEAIGQLDFLGGGYFMQVEAARVDHAAHNNDAISMILEQIEFDRTIEYLSNYVSNRDDTLLIITTDHGNGNPALSVYGPSAQRGLMSLTNAKRSFDWIFRELKERDPNLEHLSIQREIIAYATGVALKQSDLPYLNTKKVPRGDLFAHSNSRESRLASLLANRNTIAFTSKNHTSDMVVFTAQGAAATLFPPMIENTDIYPRMMHAMGLERIGANSDTLVHAHAN